MFFIFGTDVCPVVPVIVAPPPSVPICPPEVDVVSLISVSCGNSFKIDFM